MYKIICEELTGKLCDFTAEGATKEGVKNNFYAHGAQSSLHKEVYENATNEQAADFGKKLDEYLDTQN